MKFELKTDNDKFSQIYLYIFNALAIISFLIVFSSILLKLENISKYYEINYLCKLLKVDKSSSNFKRLSSLSNQTSKQKIWDFCLEIVK